MKHAVRKAIEWAGDVPRKAHIALVMRVMQYTASPQQRFALLAGAATTTAALLFVRTAHADGFADMFGKASDQGDSIKESLGKIFAAAAFGFAGWGGYNLFRKNGDKSGHSPITTGQIIGPLLAGAMLGASGFMMLRAGETVGIEASSQGQVP
ncbi:MAG: hypothetical protein HY306_10120 [Nitrosomonadales bacterium]|nr:hypothetical protein [Nitrosomonadales bacterium]